MSSARAELRESLRNADRFGRFRIYTPVTECGTDIYVHSKVTIVDDEVLRVGSANMNNRSLGLDSECDLLINAARKTDAGCAQTIADLRCNLIAEHLGVAPGEVARAFEAEGSLIKAIEKLGGDGRTLLPLTLDRPNQAEANLAGSELLDPESSGGNFGRIARPGLLRGLPSTSRYGGSVAVSQKLALIGVGLIASAWLLRLMRMRHRYGGGSSR